MIKCCGEDRESRFCPACGGQLVKWDQQSLESFLTGLLNLNAAHVEKLTEKIAKMAEEGYDHTDRALQKAQRGLRLRKKLVEKYQAWLDMVKAKGAA